MQSGVWNPAEATAAASFTNAPDATSLAARIAALAQSAPTRTAIVDENGALTFADLDNKANQLAWKLHEAAVRPESCIGLFFDRSTDFVVAALAVTKYGAAYLPMDSATPFDRAATMLLDAAAPVVLSHRAKTQHWVRADWKI